MNLDEAEIKVQTALQLLREVEAARHQLVAALPSNGRKAWMFGRFAIHDAVHHAARVLDLLSPNPIQKAG